LETISKPFAVPDKALGTTAKPLGVTDKPLETTAKGFETMLKLQRCTNAGCLTPQKAQMLRVLQRRKWP